jgi:hypothetical protein
MNRESCHGAPGVALEVAVDKTGTNAAIDSKTDCLSNIIIDERQSARLLTAKAWRRANDLPREVFDDQTFFNNPALNILLDLYVGYHEKVAINVSSACFASSAPPTTALRYITRLVQLGFVQRSNAERDQRVNLLSLTNDGIVRMDRLLDSVGASDRRLGIGRLGPVQ